MITNILPKEAYHLANKDGNLHERFVNGKYVKIYQSYAWDFSPNN